jgi:hypothetical protein
VGAVTAARAFGSLLGTLPAGKCVQQLKFECGKPV